MKQLLIIDDGLQGAVLRAKVLQRHGYQVMIANDGQSGIDLADALQPDLILLDHVLPDIDGALVNAAIKTQHPHLRIISVSAYPELEDQYCPVPEAFHTKGHSVQTMLQTVAQFS